MRKYLPLILVEGYLVATLLILFYGPVEFRLHNLPVFFLLMLLYHTCFIFGYWVAVKTGKKERVISANKISSRFYYASFIIAVVGVFGSYANMMLSTSFIPFGLFDDLARGLAEPGLVYTERMRGLDEGLTADSRWFNIISVFFAFFKLLFIFLFAYHWKQLSQIKKMTAVVYSFLFLATGISSGTNSVVFFFFFFLIPTLVVSLYLREYAHLRKLLIVCVVVMLLPIASFGFIMSQRGGGFDYFSGTSPLGDISVTAKTPDLDIGSVFEFFYYASVWLDYYVVQGYYGFSLILDLDHRWTFGFGSSAFLQRQLFLLTGVDVSSDTFQHRISQSWDESAQWHSFFGQVANDFGLVGVSLVLFVLGWFLSRVWISIISGHRVYGAALVPIFVMMFIFFPANNQVFSNIDTFSYFVFVSLLWLVEVKTGKAFGHIRK